jgi:nitrate ABC transporter ATP-binding subunit
MATSELTRAPIGAGAARAAGNGGAPLVDVVGVVKDFQVQGKPFRALDGVSLTVADREFVALIGPSGCGKSTLLSLVAGLEFPTGGHVLCNGQPVRGPGVERGMVFQHHGLLPWMTAYDNVRFALDCVWSARPPAERDAQARHYLDMVGLTSAAAKRPNQLSGGMKQRVGLARAFAANPRVLLLDEPFAALDALTRATLQAELVRLWERERKTVLMVTHDIDEAIYLADRIVVFTHGPAATIRAVLPSPFERPRNREALLEEPRYRELHHELMGMLMEELAA